MASSSAGVHPILTGRLSTRIFHFAGKKCQAFMAPKVAFPEGQLTPLLGDLSKVVPRLCLELSLLGGLAMQSAEISKPPRRGGGGGVY